MGCRRARGQVEKDDPEVLTAVDPVDQDRPDSKVNGRSNALSVIAATGTKRSLLSHLLRRQTGRQERTCRDLDIEATPGKTFVLQPPFLVSMYRSSQ